MGTRIRRLIVVAVAACALVASSCSAEEARDGVADQLATPLSTAVAPGSAATGSPTPPPGDTSTPTPLATPTAGDEVPPSAPTAEPTRTTPAAGSGDPGGPNATTPPDTRPPAPAPTPAAASPPSDGGGSTSGGGATPDRPQAPNLRVEVLERLGHDTTAFTQGLEFHEGRLYEGRGGYGQSAITEIDPVTGAVLRRADLGAEFFGEGITVVGDRVIQLTWQSERAFVFDIDTFAVVDEYTYRGEGWGLCLDDAEGRLVMSNGTDVLTFRDPDTFESSGSVAVTLNGEPLVRLNELECVDGLVWANVWRTDSIVVIDPTTGEVVSTIDASGLLTAGERAGTDVFNGIARDHDTGRWVVTGKLWPAMFVVDFVPR